MDNKQVTMLYTGFNPSDKTTVKRRQKNGGRLDVPCPTAVSAYNAHMGGVDRGDQLRGYYHHAIKSRKFYRYVMICRKHH